jgi:transcription-repair coupling factor (superfamily II helicase)
VCSYLGLENYVLPDIRVSKGEDLRSYQEELLELNDSLWRYYTSKNPKKILISSFRTLSHPLPKANYLQTFEIEFGQSLNLNELPPIEAWQILDRVLRAIKNDHS